MYFMLEVQASSCKHTIYEYIVLGSVTFVVKGGKYTSMVLAIDLFLQSFEFNNVVQPEKLDVFDLVHLCN